MNGLMDEWAAVCMALRMYDWMDGWVDDCLGGWMAVSMNGLMDEWAAVWMAARMYGCVTRRMDDWLDGWMAV
jgi:hypothetical protein